MASAQTTPRSEFYWECVKRAFRGRLVSVELTAGLLALIAVPVGYWLYPEAGGAMNWLPLGLFAAIFVGAVLFGLIAAPYSIYVELQRERNQLSAKLDTRAARQEAIARLWELRKEGVAHRNLPVQHNNPAAWAHWLRVHDDWRGEVLEHAGTVSKGLHAWLTTLDRMRPPPGTLPEPVNADHRRWRHIMSEVLWRMEEFLAAEMMNKDIARSEQ